MVLDYEIKETLNKIFSAILVGAVDKNNGMLTEIVKEQRICLHRFRGYFPSNIFLDEYAILYEIIVGKSIGIFNKSQMCTIIDNSKELILDSPYVNINKWAFVGDGRPADDLEKIEAMKQTLEDMLVELSNEFVSEEEFKSACIIYKNWFKEKYLMDTINNMAMIMSDDGLEIKKKNKGRAVYKGQEQCDKYYHERNKLIKELSETRTIRGSVINKEWLREQLEDKGDNSDDILDTGLTNIDSVIYSFKRGDMVSVIGPPKGGKTKVACYLATRALLKGLSVCVWAIEGTQAEWESMIIANIIKVRDGVSLNSSKILKNKYRSDPDKMKLINSAKTILALGKETGTLSFIKGTCYVESFIQDIEDHYANEACFDVIVVDPLINIQSKTGRGQTDRASEAYITLANYCKNEAKIPLLSIVTAQFKQSTIDFIRSNPNETIDVTAGGVTHETIRTPDISIGLMSTKQERSCGQMKIYCIASRHSEAFDDFTAGCDLGCCDLFDFVG